MAYRVGIAKTAALIVTLFSLAVSVACKSPAPVSSIALEEEENYWDIGEEDPSNISVTYGNDKKAETLYETTMKTDLLCIMAAYPGYIADVEKQGDGKVYVVMKSGKRIIYDDRKDKSTEEKLENPDLQDMMEQVYPLGEIASIMDTDFDPGRARVYDLLCEVYGGLEAQVKANLVNVRTRLGNFLFNQRNKAAESLSAAMADLEGLVKEKPAVYSFIFPIGGTFNYRHIAGTNRLSAHSFGIAIDFASNGKDYWKWSSREEGQKRLSAFPQEIVGIFEDHGFIWGGKWGHFDIMHFEYRPEIILKSKCYTADPVQEGEWFERFPYKDEEFKKNVELIRSALE